MGILADLGVDEKEMTELAKRLLANKKWLDNNYNKIGEKYSNKYVAVDNDQLLDSDENIEILVQRLKKENKNIDRVLIELVNPKNAQLIL